MTVGTGQFAAHMMVELTNDGPVTILLDSSKSFKGKTLMIIKKFVDSYFGVNTYVLGDEKTKNVQL